jgi:hypothetical protein
MSGTCGTVQRIGLWAKATGPEGKTVPIIRRFIYIWEYVSGKWNTVGIYLTDGNGTLFNVEDDVRKEYTDSKSTAKKDNTAPLFLSSRGPDLNMPSKKKHLPFSPKIGGEYFLCYLPLDLLFRAQYCSDNPNIKTWAEKKEALLKEPPKHWLDAPEYYGRRAKITEKLLAAGVFIPLNWCEWLRALVKLVDRAEWYRNNATARKRPYLDVIQFIDTISEILEVTAKYGSDTETGRYSLSQSREYALYHLDQFSQRIQKKYLSKNVLQIEYAAYLEIAKNLIAVFNDDSFKKCFLLFSIADRRCDGSTAFSMQNQSNSAVEFDPIHFLYMNRVDEIIRSAYAAMKFDPTDKLVRQYYEQSILPVELSLADLLDDEENASIKEMFSDPKLKKQFLAGCTADQKKALDEAIVAGCERISNPSYLSMLERSHPGIRKVLEEMEPKNPVWNWVKDSAQANIDDFLGIFQEVRESWATASFAENPKLKGPFIASVTKSVFLIKVSIAGYKVYQKKGGTLGAAVKMSAKNYLASVKGRMLDMNRWVTDENGNRFGGTPQNLNMIFSAIGVVVSMQGIYSFGQKCISGKKPEIDDYVDLCMSLSSGASSFMGLLPEGMSDCPLTRALSRVFFPLSIACDLTATIKLARKSQLYYAQGQIEKSIYTGIKTSIQLGSAGFSVASLFRGRFLTKMLLQREMLIGAGSRMLGLTFLWVTAACELFGAYLKAIEPEGSKLAKEGLKQLDSLINDDPNKSQDTISETVNSVTVDVPKINYKDKELCWKDSDEFNGKKIYKDENRAWNWLQLRNLINDEIVGVPPLKGIGWVKEFDKEKVLVELVEKGIDINVIAKVCKKKKEEIEYLYRNAIAEKYKIAQNKMLSKTEKEKNLVALLS